MKLSQGIMTATILLVCANFAWSASGDIQAGGGGGSGGSSANANYAMQAGYAQSANTCNYSLNANTCAYATTGGNVQYAANANIASWAQSANVASYASTGGNVLFAQNANLASFAGVAYSTSGNANTATFAQSANVSNYASNANLASYASASGVSASTTGNANTASYASNANIASYALNSNLASYAATSGMSLSTSGNANTATYAQSANVSNYASNANLSVYASSAGVSSSTTGNANTANYAANSNVASYSLNSNTSSYSSNSNIAAFAQSANVSNYATNSNAAVYAQNSNLAVYSQNSNLASYASNSNVATYATSAGTANIATNSTNSNNALMATSATNVVSGGNVTTGALTANSALVSGNENVSGTLSVGGLSTLGALYAQAANVLSLTGNANALNIGVISNPNAIVVAQYTDAAYGETQYGFAVPPRTGTNPSNFNSGMLAFGGLDANHLGLVGVSANPNGVAGFTGGTLNLRNGDNSATLGSGYSADFFYSAHAGPFHANNGGTATAPVFQICNTLNANSNAYINCSGMHAGAGILYLDSNGTIGLTLDANQKATFAGNVVVNQNLVVTGASNVSGTSTLGVLSAGASTFASSNVTANETVGGTFSVTGVSTLGALSAGASTFTSTTVTGATSVGALTATSLASNSNVTNANNIYMPNANGINTSAIFLGPLTSSGVQIIRNGAGIVQFGLADASGNATLQFAQAKATNDLGVGAPNFSTGYKTNYGLYVSNSLSTTNIVTAGVSALAADATQNITVTGNLSGQRRGSTTKTAAYTFATGQTGDSGKTFNNNGAAAAVPFTLPACATATLGFGARISNLTASGSNGFTLTTNGTDTILLGGVSQTNKTTITTTVLGSAVEFNCEAAGVWSTIFSGTFTSN